MQYGVLLLRTTCRPFRCSRSARSICGSLLVLRLLADRLLVNDMADQPILSGRASKNRRRINVSASHRKYAYCDGH